jgi:hypothetical protein
VTELVVGWMTMGLAVYYCLVRSDDWYSCVILTVLVVKLVRTVKMDVKKLNNGGVEETL